MPYATEELRKLRKASGRLPEELAADIGYKLASYVNVECGNHQMREEYFERAAAVLNVSATLLWTKQPLRERGAA